MGPPIYRFSHFLLNCERFELSRDGQNIKLERKPMELLILLAGSNGRLLTRTEIAERLWDKEVFVDTEHGINTAVRKIRAVLDDDSGEPRFVETVQGRGYRFVAPVTVEDVAEVGAVVTEAPASAALMSPEETSESPADPGIRKIFGSSPAIWFAGLAVVAVIALVAEIALAPHSLASWITDRGKAAPIRSLAVIPLDNLSGNPNEEYFADGMTDELITQLARESTLRITSRTSVMQYKGVHRPLPQIARELGVDGILEGSVARSNNEVHMTLQLIRADTDSHVWADSYDRTASEAASLPQDAARAIAIRLHSTTATGQPARAINAAAHDAYLHGRYLWWTNSAEGSLPFFEKAVELQPDYAAAWFGVSSYYGAGVMFGNLDPRIYLSKEQDAARKCLELDSSAVECHLAETGALICNWDLEGALKEAARAIELDPKSSEAYELRAQILLAMGKNDEGLEAEKTSLDLNQANQTGWTLELWQARHYDEAIKDIRERLVATPHDSTMQLFLAASYRGKGMNKESIEALEKSYLFSEGKAASDALHAAYQRGGVPGAVEWQIKHLEATARKTYVSPVNLAELYAQLGDREKTMALLEEAYRQHSPQLQWVQCDAAYDFLRDDAGFRALMKRVGVPVRS